MDGVHVLPLGVGPSVRFHLAFRSPNTYPCRKCTITRAGRKARDGDMCGAFAQQGYLRGREVCFSSKGVKGSLDMAGKNMLMVIAGRAR